MYPLNYISCFNKICRIYNITSGDSKCTLYIVTGIHIHHKKNILLSCDRDLWPMTLTFELDTDMAKVKQQAKYLDQ